MIKITQNNKGVSLVIVIIIVSAITLMVGVAATLQGIDEAQIGFNQNKSIETFTATDGCIEEALVKLNSNHSYSGEVLAMGDVSCTITVTGSGNTRTINVVSTHDALYSNEINVDVDWSSTFQITSWQEVTT